MTQINFPLQAPQGWECPKCHRVYSPATPACFYCGNSKITDETTAKDEGCRHEQKYRR